MTLHSWGCVNFIEIHKAVGLISYGQGCAIPSGLQEVDTAYASDERSSGSV